MEPVLVRLLLVLALVAVVSLLGWLWRRRDGRVRETRAGSAGAAAPTEASTEGHGPGFDADQLDAVGLDLEGVRAGAVLLTSPTCAPCATVKRILAELSEARDDVSWVAVDASDHLDLARTHHVMRVPTLFLLDVHGQILARTSGVPARVDLERVLDRQATLRS